MPTRNVKNAGLTASTMKTDNRVSWSNHLSSEATLIRMDEERKLRMGDAAHQPADSGISRAF